MKYLLLCQVKPASFANVSEADYAEMMGSMMAYNQQLLQAGVMVAAGQLDDPDKAQRVSAHEDGVQIQGGPALPGDIQIGGYYLIDVQGEAEATGWAAKCPIAEFGAVEVRHVVFAPV